MAFATALLVLLLIACVCRAAPGAATPMFWHCVKNYDLQPLLHGKASLPGPYKDYFNRLPASSVNSTRPSIYGLQQQPAGMFIQFRTNTSAVHVRYTLGRSQLSMWHFRASGVSGMDAYAWDDKNAPWRWTGTSRPVYPITESKLAQLRCEAPNCPMKTFRIHLPTYNTVADDFAVGVSSALDAFVPDASHFQSAKNASIVWYGSSILQGAVASRPGQIMTHQVSRNLGTLILNFGFSGNCLMEQSVAAYLVQIDPPPSLFIIDCNPNMNFSLIANRVVPLVEYIRKNGHPTTPIVLVR